MDADREQFAISVSDFQYFDRLFSTGRPGQKNFKTAQQLLAWRIALSVSCCGGCRYYLSYTFPDYETKEANEQVL